MPLSPLQSQRISEAVGQKVKNPCPLCGQRDWGWGPDLVVLQAQRYSTAPDLTVGLAAIWRAGGQPSPLDRLKEMGILPPDPPPAYPTLPVMCNTCGNTVLLNVYMLGIADIWPSIAAGRAS